MVEQNTLLRESKTQLRAFERNLEDEMPNLERLSQFKSIAQELIENPKHKTRRHASQRRTQRETEELYEKLKQYQIEHPNTDITSLYESYQADRARL